MIKRFLLCLILSLPIFAWANHSTPLVDEPQVQDFIHMMVEKHGFSESYLEGLFQKTQIDPLVLQAMRKPYESKPWDKYREFFITPKRILDGARFWEAHAKTLERAEKEYQVPQEIIVAIIGVESNYGENKGKYPVFSTLATLAFAYPARSKFFKSELAEYLLLTREQNVDPLSLYGSYAGALGQPQFMPSSYRRYAIDFNGDGKKDLFNNDDDVIGSVANYFHHHGWKDKEPTVIPARVTGIKYKILPFNRYQHYLNQQELAKFGVYGNFGENSPNPTYVINMRSKKQSSLWIG
ncbi:MAG: lytic murein transglycosylase B, partial [Proteobacteria bacterium]|nr:lytic murein transglycosylase B [Pseudomonadota bacterium]